jgi:hypothetical protein
VARIQIVEGPERISHEDGQRMVIVQSNVRGRDLGSFAAEVQREVQRRVSLPEGYFLTYGSQFENQQRAMRDSHQVTCPRTCTSSRGLPVAYSLKRECAAEMLGRLVPCILERHLGVRCRDEEVGRF